jgi:hypothetical protein
MLRVEGEVTEEEPDEDYIETVRFTYSVFEGGVHHRVAYVAHALEVGIREV